jgi:hypothetical protein
MADSPRHSDDNADADHTRPRPRWLYAAGIVIVALVLLAVVLHLAGGGLHRHTLP